MTFKFNTIVSLIFALLATWAIFAAMPFFRLNGLYPQVDTQIIYLHILCGLMAIYLAGRLITNKCDIESFNHPLIYLPFLLAINGIVSGILGKNFNYSLFGAPQIGQGVFWYFDIAVMSIIFSQIVHVKPIRIILFINISAITFIVSFFTFFPYWKGLPISFYYFTDYLCFYGVLNFILLTTITKNRYIIFQKHIAPLSVSMDAVNCKFLSLLLLLRLKNS